MVNRRKIENLKYKIFDEKEELFKAIHDCFQVEIKLNEMFKSFDSFILDISIPSKDNSIFYQIQVDLIIEDDDYYNALFVINDINY